MAEIIGIFGLQGYGKTTFATYLAGMAYADGNDIYSNYTLKHIPFTPVRSLSDINKVRSGWLILDEVWLWLFSRTSMSKMNQELMKIIMLNRKRDVNIVYTAQLKRTVDVILRDVTTYFVHPKVENFIFKRKDGKKVENAGLSYFVIDPYGRISNEKVLPFPVETYGQFFDTREEIEDLEEKKQTPLDKGIGLERDFKVAISKINGVRHIELIPRSGIGSTWAFDVIAYTDYGVFAFDVKSAKTHVYINNFGDGLRKQIRNAITHKAIPYIAFPVNDRRRLTTPNAWHIYRLSYDSYLCIVRSNPRYGKLAKESILLSDWNCK